MIWCLVSASTVKPYCYICRRRWILLPCVREGRKTKGVSCFLKPFNKASNNFPQEQGSHCLIMYLYHFHPFLFLLPCVFLCVILFSVAHLYMYLGHDHLGLDNQLGQVRGLVPSENGFSISQQTIISCSSLSRGEALWNFSCPHWHVSWCGHYTVLV